MFCGMLISTSGASMIWPFLMIYVSERLQLPLATVASLMTLSSAMGLISSFVFGPIIDRVGRKWVMALSLLMNAGGYLFMSQANSLPIFALLMAVNGTFNPLYRVGSDAMMADLIPPEKRADAYSLMRMSNNLGVALGPAVGGMIAVTSYSLAFYFAAAGLGIYGVLIMLFAAETLPGRVRGVSREVLTVRSQAGERFGGYGEIFRDRPFVRFVGAFTLVQLCAALVWVLMGVYAKHNYGVLENQFGLIPMTNALLVVFFQIAVTRIAKRHAPLRVLALGSLFYAIATGCVALATGFWGFWLVMVALTVGELILVPTSSTYAANLAPADKRGRYMSLYGLSWGVASGVGPVVGGALNDTLGPRSPWIVGSLIGLCSTIAFLRLVSRTPAPRPAEPVVGA